jgi:hypothetical protein
MKPWPHMLCYAAFQDSNLIPSFTHYSLRLNNSNCFPHFDLTLSIESGTRSSFSPRFLGNLFVIWWMIHQFHVFLLKFFTWASILLSWVVLIDHMKLLFFNILFWWIIFPQSLVMCLFVVLSNFNEWWED